MVRNWVETLTWLESVTSMTIFPAAPSVRLTSVMLPVPMAMISLKVAVRVCPAETSSASSAGDLLMMTGGMVSSARRSFQQFDHGPSHGITDQGVGFGVIHVVEALTAGRLLAHASSRWCRRRRHCSRRPGKDWDRSHSAGHCRWCPTAARVPSAATEADRGHDKGAEGALNSVRRELIRRSSLLSYWVA
jgi:hypothetical protein